MYDIVYICYTTGPQDIITCLLDVFVIQKRNLQIKMTAGAIHAGGTE